MDMNETRGLLVQEATELLASMEVALLDIEENGASAELINEIFRSAHTIKGSSGLFGLDLIVSFTHVMESVLVRVRNQEIGIDPTMSSLLLNCGDYVGSMISALSHADELVDPDSELRSQLLARLKVYLAPEARSETVLTPASAAASNGSAIWQIIIKPAPDILCQGMDPISFISYLTSMGEIVRIQTDLDRLPLLSKLDPEECYLAFNFDLCSDASQHAIEQALEFIRDGSEISITQQAQHNPSTPTASAENSGNTAKPATGIANAENKRSAEQVLLRVDARKLDQLIDSVGELVTRSASGRTLTTASPKNAIQEFMEEIELFVEQIRDRALSLRMAPVGEIFQRFPRVVRDVSKELGKKIELSINGADTELDKSMIDKLGDPLMHIIRNAMDHGIESTEKRIAAGKQEKGSLHLNAYHESGYVVIEVIDDGKGLDKSRILEKAIERGLIESSQILSDQEIFMLIFEPGFSTADKVTDLSGRGVGMDVVRRNIEELHGTVEIESVETVGTTMRIRLPLTLSIIDGFQVAVAESNFVIPLEMVVECVDMPESNDSSKHIVNLRGTPLPYIRLADEFGIESNTSRQCLVVLKFGQQRAGIAVDRLVGELQAVIKPLNFLLRGVKGLSGSTILGDGKVALILDVVPLLSRTKKTAGFALAQ